MVVPVRTATLAKDRLWQTLRLVSVLPSLALLAGLCWACAQQATFGGLPGWLLPSLGVAAPLASFGLVVRRRFEVADALQAFVAAGGVLLLTAARTLGQTPCPLCLAFWTLQALLTLELLISPRPLARAGFALVTTAVLASVMVATVPAARYGVVNLLPLPSVETQGLRRGAAVPAGLGLPESGLVAVATDCAPCVRNTLRPAVEAVARGRQITLVVPVGRADLARGFPDARVVGIAPHDFARLGLRPEGTPHLFVLARGRVLYGATAPTARLEAPNVP